MRILTFDEIEFHKYTLQYNGERNLQIRKRIHTNTKLYTVLNALTIALEDLENHFNQASTFTYGLIEHLTKTNFPTLEDKHIIKIMNNYPKHGKIITLQDLLPLIDEYKQKQPELTKLLQNQEKKYLLGSALTYALWENS